MRILSPSSTHRLLATIPTRSPFGARDHALVRLFAQTGLRVAEMVGLDDRSRKLKPSTDLPTALDRMRK